MSYLPGELFPLRLEHPLAEEGPEPGALGHLQDSVNTPPSLPCILPYRQPGPGPPTRSYLYTGRRPPQAPQACVSPGQGAALPGLGLPAAAVGAGAAHLLALSGTCKTQVKVGLTRLGTFSPLLSFPTTL